VSAHAAAPGLLEPLLVVEVGHRIAVGACGGLLAQLGATVVVIEPPNPSAQGKWRNRAVMLAGKESVVIAPGDAADASLQRELLARADVVLLSTDDGATDVAWDAPRPASQIVCDVTAFGHEGPLAGRGGDEPIVAALSAVVETTGPADGPPAVIGAPVLEMSTAVFAAAAIVAACRVRRHTGCGQRIDMAIFDTAVNELANFLPLHFERQPATRSGNRHPLHVPWGSFRARDGFVLICSVTADQFARICKAIGKPELAADERFATSGGRLRHFREMDAHIEAWTRERTVAECEAALTPLGVACGPILTVDRLAHEANLAHRASVRMLDDPATGRPVPVPASPLRAVPCAGRSPMHIPAPDSGRPAVAALLASRAASSEAPVVQGDRPSDVRPLAGVRVVEIGQYTVAPLASRHLGALGADVIKIEPPAGDAIRFSSPLRADGLSHIFAISNTDKRGLVLDLRDAAQREKLHRILAQADMLVENLRPGALAKLGFGGDALRERHPTLIYCSINGFGNDSSYPGRPALDTVIQAMSGLMSLTEVDGAPMKAGISASDMLGGEFGLLALLAALEHRDRTGRAAHFDLSMQDCSIWMTQIAWPGSSPAAAHAIVRAADGYVVAMTTAARVRGLLGETAGRDRASIVEALAAAGVDSAPVATVAEVANSAQVAARGLLLSRPTSDGDRWTVLGSPLRLRATPGRVRTAMPRLGAEDAIINDEFALREPSSGGAESGPRPQREAS